MSRTYADGRIKGHQDRADEVARLRASLANVLKAYAAERDCLYDSVTTSNGEFDTEDDRREVDEMDVIIAEARATLEATK